ncbi:homeotic protein female sterile [Sabethes cyaneus]|uniref:homeotic protein female sterile n=1 Tax=Sabethes cyaneus TaxID=53552 RepID=UPI00237EAA78|nr:homeotic protein female sterile [Sabethes cyaneus]
MSLTDRSPLFNMSPGRNTRMAPGKLGSSSFGTTGEERKRTGEIIHSGQFMVSHFETEGQEDEDDDDLGMQVVVEDVKPAIVDTVISNIISKRSPHLSLESVNSASSSAIVPLRGQSSGSTELIRYAQKRQPLQLTGRYPCSQVEIDTDLSTVFNTLNVTYTQKLTSPKWNPFKGIRLRWKEKIRLNNVIWRCWYMQFVMKRKTLVCQFASPLDVDIHNTPQAILLEGKYWKRKCNVIKAEYKKWRRFYVNKALGATNITDTTSELDFLEWSPSSEPMFMITDNMPTDTLFSTLSQYPFPDSREIARGAGRADFIQPSLGPLQPNFDDLMDLDLDFLNFSRLPPVPEEGSEDILKAIDYNYPLGVSTQSNSGCSIEEITDSPADQAQTQSQPARSGVNASSVITGPAASLVVGPPQAPSTPTTIQFSAKIFTQNVASNSTSTSQQQLNNALGSYISAQIPQPIVTANVPTASNTSEQTATVIPVVASSEDLNKDTKTKYSRNLLKQLGREPHNYDKCPPTTHQTMAYNLVQQPHLSQNILNSPYPASAYQIQSGGIIQISGTPSNQQLLNFNSSMQMQPNNTAVNPMNLSNNSLSVNNNQNYMMQNMSPKLITHSQSLPIQTNQQKAQPRSNSMPTTQNYPHILASQSSPPGTIHQQHQQDAFKGSLHPTQSSNYKFYHSHQPQPYKIPSQSAGSYGGSGRSMRHASPPHGHQSHAAVLAAQQQQQQATIEQTQQQLHDLQQQQQQQQQLSPQPQQKRLPPHPTKEMFRSNSLPINATFALPPKEENFAVPRYHAKSTPKLKARSNSMIMKVPGSSGSNMVTSIGGTNLHATTSEPMLNAGSSALLAQLLTTNNASTLLNIKQSNSPSSAIGNLSPQQQQQQQQQQSHSHIVQHQQQQSIYQQLTLGSPISPTSSQLQLNQSQHSPQLQSQQHLNAMVNASAGQSVLNYASSSSCLPGISLATTQSLSPDTMLDQDAPMSPISMGTGSCDSIVGTNSGSSSGGVGNKFHQQCARGDNQRRSGHIHAEQKRRYNIKNGFDMLHSLIPQLQQNPNAKLSKAAMLQKGAEYIKQLRSERSATSDQMDALRREIDALNNSLSNLQTALPASGAPVSRQRTGRVKELYHQYVRQRTMDNWKFWIFGLIFEPLMNTFNQTVSVASLDEMCRTSQLWVDQHCSLVELRPAVSNKLRQLSTTTDILSDPPTSLQEEVLKAISTSLPLPNSSGGSSSSRCGSNGSSPNRNSGGFQ